MLINVSNQIWKNAEQRCAHLLREGQTRMDIKCIGNRQVTWWWPRDINCLLILKFNVRRSMMSVLLAKLKSGGMFWSNDPNAVWLNYARSFKTNLRQWVDAIRKHMIPLLVIKITCPGLCYLYGEPRLHMTNDTSGTQYMAMTTM